jgi:hypothetical protein
VSQVTVTPLWKPHPHPVPRRSRPPRTARRSRRRRPRRCLPRRLRLHQRLGHCHPHRSLGRRLRGLPYDRRRRRAHARTAQRLEPTARKEASQGDMHLAIDLHNLTLNTCELGRSVSTSTVVAYTGEASCVPIDCLIGHAADRTGRPAKNPWRVARCRRRPAQAGRNGS